MRQARGEESTSESEFGEVRAESAAWQKLGSVKCVYVISKNLFSDNGGREGRMRNKSAIFKLFGRIRKFLRG